MVNVHSNKNKKNQKKTLPHKDNVHSYKNQKNKNTPPQSCVQFMKKNSPTKLHPIHDVYEKGTAVSYKKRRKLPHKTEPNSCVQFMKKNSPTKLHLHSRLTSPAPTHGGSGEAQRTPTSGTRKESQSRRRCQ